MSESFLTGITLGQLLPRTTFPICVCKCPFTQFLLSGSSVNIPTGSCFFHLCALSHSVISDSSAIPWTVAPQAPPSMEFFQGRTLEQVAVSFSRGSSWPSGWTHVCCISCFGRRILCYCTPWEAHFFHRPFTFYSYFTSNIIPGGPVGKTPSS